MVWIVGGGRERCFIGGQKQESKNPRKTKKKTHPTISRGWVAEVLLENIGDKLYIQQYKSGYVSYDTPLNVIIYGH